MESTKRDSQMKQTAVQWLVNEEYQNYKSVIDMAKSMEKQQIMEAYLEGCKSVRFEREVKSIVESYDDDTIEDREFLSAEQYYKEIYE
jgi:hypothetical protein